jgi:hypothetical protein
MMIPQVFHAKHSALAVRTCVTIPMQNNRRKIISSYAGRKSDGWRYFICIQRSEEPTIKLRVLNKECLLYHANIRKADLEQQRQKLGMTNWDAYFTFLKGVLCDGKGNIEVTQVLQSKYCRFFADNFRFDYMIFILVA